MKKGNLVPSEISLTLQPAVTTRGSSIDPRRMEVERHSLETETSVGESCQEYQRQASPGSQYTTNNNHNINAKVITQKFTWIEAHMLALHLIFYFFG